MSLNPDYDREADVLYLTIGDPSGPSECEDRRDGITVRYSAFDMKPVGVIVVGYDQYGWPSRASRLARIVGEILAIPSGDVRRALPSCRAVESDVKKLARDMAAKLKKVAAK